MAVLSILVLSILVLSILVLSILVLSILVLSMAFLSMALLSMADLSMAVLSMAVLSMAVLSMAVLSMAVLSIVVLSIPSSGYREGDMDTNKFRYIYMATGFDCCKELFQKKCMHCIYREEFQFKANVWTHLLIQGFFFMFTMFSIVE
jgi:hypothetical protein